MSNVIPSNMIDLEGIEQGDNQATADSIKVLSNALNVLLARTQFPLESGFNNVVIAGGLTIRGLNMGGPAGAQNELTFTGEGLGTFRTGAGGVIISMPSSAGFGNVTLGATSYGSGAHPGSGLVIGSNTAGSGAAGFIGLYKKNGVQRYLWIDTNSQLRINTAPPNETAGEDVSGAIIGPPVWTDQSFSAGDYYMKTGGGTWTIGSPAVIQNRYTVFGNIMVWSFYVSWFSGSNALAGTVTQVAIKLPGGYSCPASSILAIDYAQDTAGPGLSELYCAPTLTELIIARKDGANFTAGGALGVSATLTFEVS